MSHADDLLRAAQIVKNEAGYTHSKELGNYILNSRGKNEH